LHHGWRCGNMVLNNLVSHEGIDVNERNYHTRVPGLQTPELHDEEKQKEANRSRRVQKILLLVQ
jgi:hypothetical protein